MQLEEIDFVGSDAGGSSNSGDLPSRSHKRFRIPRFRRVLVSLRSNVFVRYLSEFRSLKRDLFLANFFAILQALSLIPISLFFKRIIDVYIPQKDSVGILYITGAGMLLWVMHVLAVVRSRHHTLICTKTVTERLRARLTMKLQQMSLSFHDNEKAASLHARVVLDTERIDVMAANLVVNVLVSIVLSLSAAVLLALMNLKLFVLLALMVPFYFIIQRVYGPRLKEGHGQFRREMEQMSSIVSEVLHSIRLVKSFAMERYEQGRVEERFHRVTDRGVKVFTQSAAFQIMLQCVGGMATLGIFTVGGWMVISDHLTVGEVVAFSSLMALFLNPINSLIGAMDSMLAGRAGLVSVYGLSDLFDTEETEHLPEADLHGAVEFENVSFAYSPGNWILHDIAFKSEPGEQIALVGGSGAGKTTLVNMVLAFYRATTGRVLLDGIDVRALNLRTLREQIGVVSQDNVLVGGSIRDNIRYGRLNAGQAEIEAAARLANAHDFISSLPEGYNTEIGDRGVRMSGGQKQRIAIARAILKNPRILILDEATSALDSESEKAVQEAMESLRKDRTSFIIAHRLSTVRNADRIMVMRQGRIVESGTFDELINRGGEFFRYYRIQFARENENAPHSATA